MGALDIATVTIRSESGDEVVAVHGGFVEVSNDTVTILSDVAELGSQIDVDRAQRAATDADQRMQQQPRRRGRGRRLPGACPACGRRGRPGTC